MILAGAGATIAGWAINLAGATIGDAIYFAGAGATMAGWAMILAGAAIIFAVEWRVTTALNPFTASAVCEW